MKKIVYSAAIVCLLAAAVSCKSTKTKAAPQVETEEAAAVTEETSDNQASDSETPKTDAESSDSAESAEASGEKTSEVKKDGSSEPSDLAATEPKDFTGWIKSSKKNVTQRIGNIQIKIKSGVGSYTLAALNEDEKAIPVLSKANEYVTNAFYLKTSKKIYNLVTDSNVRSAARRTTDGALLMYEIPSQVQMTVKFACFASEKKKDMDMIKVTATVKNIGNRSDEFVFKSVMDTVLGEAAAYHFYTWEDVPVKSETLYRTLQNQKWFVSKNANAQMQFFFSGADCTVPDLVALANYSTLERNSWEPDMLSYRVFDTLLSYNNSALCAIWKPMKLGPSESGKVVFYIALSGSAAPATGEKYVYSKEFTETEEDKPKPALPGVEIITSNAPVTEGPASVTEIPANDPFVPQPEKMTEVPTVDFYIKNMTKEHLTPEYIQSLLDRIAALEEDSPSLNRQELLQLNAELDAILTYLRQ